MLKKLARLSCRDLLVLAESLVCVSAIRLAVWFVPFRYLRPAPSVAARHAADTDRLTRAVLAAAAGRSNTQYVSVLARSAGI